MRRVSDRDARNVPEGERCRPNYALSRARDAGNAPPGNRGAVGYPSNSRPALSGPLGPRNRRRGVRTHPLPLQTVVRTRIPKKSRNGRHLLPGRAPRLVLYERLVAGVRPVERKAPDGSSPTRVTCSRGRLCPLSRRQSRGSTSPNCFPGKSGFASLSSTDTRSRVGFGDPARSKIASSAGDERNQTAIDRLRTSKLALQLLLFSPDPRGAASRHSRSAPAVWKRAPIAVALAVCATYF